MAPNRQVKPAGQQEIYQGNPQEDSEVQVTAPAQNIAMSPEDQARNAMNTLAQDKVIPLEIPYKHTIGKAMGLMWP
eukprot:7851521-Ditylum_brightwellii.AAC.1